MREEYKPKIVTKGRIDLDRPSKKTGESSKTKPASTQPKEKEVVKQSVPQPEEVQPQPITPEPAVAAEVIVPAKNEAVVSSVRPEEKKEEKEIIVEKEPVVEKKTELVEKPVAAQNQTESAEPVAEAKGEGDLFRLNTPKFESKIKVTGKIDLAALNQSTRPKKKSKEERKKERDEKRDPKFVAKPGTPGSAVNKDNNANGASHAKSNDDAEKKKRKRIKKDRVDINNTPGTNARPAAHRNDDRKPRLKKPVKAEVSEEDVQKQIKETLARLTNKGNKNNKGAKYRRDKREAFQKREHELQELEELESKTLKLTEFVTANDLANMMNVPVNQVIATCMSIGMMVSINQRLDAETINIVVDEFGFKTEYVSADVVEAIKTEDEDDQEDWVSRPPIVTVMGHVDHGKTSLLDNIRSANVIAGEAGGITQHIGAYNVKLPSGRRITFLDTPGHEAFTAMRARGAKVTDIAIIIVAADDNVMPQTIEAINHASAANVPIVFAINKVDKPHANPEKIKEELANMNYLVEDWGGKYQSQEISAKKGTGIDELLVKVLFEADLLDLKANPAQIGRAHV